MPKLRAKEARFLMLSLNAHLKRVGHPPVMSFWETVLAVWVVIAVTGVAVMLVSMGTDLTD